MPRLQDSVTRGARLRKAVPARASGSVTCTPVEVDRYDRDVAVCVVGGSDLAEFMVHAGHAINDGRRARYAAAESAARQARRGLWAGEFEQPAAWRQQNTRQ